MQDRAWDRRWHRWLPVAPGWVSLQDIGLAMEVRCSEPQEVSGDDSRPQGVSSDLTMFSNATPLLTKHKGWPRLPQGRHPGHCVGRGSTEGFLHKISYAEAWIKENTQPERPQPPAWPSSSCRWLWRSLSPLGSSVPLQHPRVLSPGSHQSLQNPTRSSHSQA